MNDGVATNIGSNVAGIGSLLNSLKIESSVSLDDAEKRIMREFSDMKFEDDDSVSETADEVDEVDPFKMYEQNIASIDSSDDGNEDEDDDDDNDEEEEDDDNDANDDDGAIDLTAPRPTYGGMSVNHTTAIQPIRSAQIVPKLNIDIERDAEEDRKNQLLEQIDSLRDDLDELGVSTDRIHHVTFDSPMRQVVDVHKRLMFKYNKLKYNSIAEEAIVAGAGLLEMIFNGKQTYFGCKPDITGYSDVVKSKLKRIRYETSSAVNRFVTSNNVGGMTMIAMELLPSLITQSQRRRLQASDTISVGPSVVAHNNRESIRSHISDLNSMI